MSVLPITSETILNDMKNKYYELPEPSIHNHNRKTYNKT